MKTFTVVSVNSQDGSRLMMSYVHVEDDQTALDALQGIGKDPASVVVFEGRLQHLLPEEMGIKTSRTRNLNAQDEQGGEQG